MIRARERPGFEHEGSRMEWPDAGLVGSHPEVSEDVLRDGEPPEVCFQFHDTGLVLRWCSSSMTTMMSSCRLVDDVVKVDRDLPPDSTYCW